MISCPAIKQVCLSLLIVLSGWLVIDFSTPAYAKWKGAIGTGISRTQVKGDQGVGGDFFGPVLTGVDLSPSDFNDQLNTSIAMDLSMTDDRWMVDVSLGLQEFEDPSFTRLSDGATDRSNMNFDTTAAEITIGRPVFRHPRVTLGVHGGLRYDRHKLSVDLTQGATTENVNTDENWTDVLIGISVEIPFTEKWIWSNKMNGGFGGSEGTYFLSSGVTWRFHPRWSTEVVGDYTAINYENGHRGDTDWYLYEVDEFIWGVNVLFHW
ncbi:hypothetical protein [Desulfoluna sp.]|uniref:hypothetical protein n=1 Tax=Desulfoluna sp. TaxID=2045199 RepID=UPI00262B407F|nr:hypothetical protein [Desulfoluna sp.]